MTIPTFEGRHLSRRSFLNAVVVGAAGLALPTRAFAWDRSKALDAAILESPLVYISPLQSNGRESRCHGEVWFVADGGDLLVVTNPDRWRAAAIGRGLGRARLWVGDFGPWQKSDGRFRDAPTCVAKARLDGDSAVHERALAAFGKKYAAEWGKWGPRFREGLASGDRVLIRYSPSEG